MENYLTLQAASKKYGLSVDTLRSYIRKNLLPMKRIGLQRIYINENDLLAIGNDKTANTKLGTANV